MPYATYNEITTADKSSNPSYVFITWEQYSQLLDGIVNGLQVFINSNGDASLRQPEPLGYNGSNYVYDEALEIWVPVVFDEDQP